jgi:hypothetical protein
MGGIHPQGRLECRDCLFEPSLFLVCIAKIVVCHGIAGIGLNGGLELMDSLIHSPCLA